MKDVQFLNNVQPLRNVQFLQNVRPLANVGGLQDVTPFASGTNNYVPKAYAYNNLGEKANSTLDVLLGKDQRDVLLDEEGLSWLKDIPVLRLVGGELALLKDKYADPIIENGLSSQAFKEIGLNTLTEVSEDLDIFSNIIKSQVINPEGNHLESLANALGLNGTRVAYNYDTGNWFADVALEILSDPLTVAEMGSSILAKAGKESAEGAVKVATRELTEGLSEQAAKDFANAVTETLVKEGTNITDDTFEHIVKRINSRSLKEIADAGLKQNTDNLITAAAKSDGYRLFNSATKFHTAVNDIDNAITSATWLLTPAGVAAKYGGETIKSAVTAIYNNIIRTLDKYDLTKNFVKKQGAFKEALSTAMYQNKAIFETVFRNNVDFFRRVGIDEIQFQQYMYAMLKELEHRNANVDVFDSFVDYLTKHNEKFANLMNIDKTFSDYINSNAFQELVEVTRVAPEAIMRAQQELNTSYHKATFNSMQKYINSNKNNLEAMYKYIDDTVLNYNGKHFGLRDIDGFLNEILTSPTTSKNYAMQLATLLESTGIDRYNAINIDKILKSRIKDKNKAIMRTLEQSTKTKLLTYQDYDKMFTKISNKIDANTNTVLNKVWKEDIATHNIDQYKYVIDDSYKNVEQAVKDIQENIPFKIGDTNYRGHKIVYDIQGSDLMKNTHDGIIHVNKAQVENGYKNKSWQHRAYDKLKNYKFESLDDFTQFLVYHEIAHDKITPESIGLLRSQIIANTRPYYIYESAVDREALRMFEQYKRPIKYVQNTIRLQDLPDFEETLALINRATTDNKMLLDVTITGITQSDIDAAAQFFKDTNNIFSKLDTDYTTAFDIPKWYSELESAQHNLDRIQRAFTQFGGPDAVQAREKIFRIQQALDVFKEGKVADSLVNYVDNINGLVQAQLSHLGMFSILTQHTHLSKNPQLKFFLEQMANPDSIYRIHVIPNLVDAMKETMPTHAEQINKVVAQIDTVTNLNKLRTAELATGFSLSNKLQDDIRNIVYDVIDNHKQYLIADILTNEFAAQTRSSYESALQKILSENVDITLEEADKLARKELRTYRQILDESIDNHIDKTKTILERIASDASTANLDQATVMKEIKEQAHKLLDDYINSQAALQKYVDNISLSTLYDVDTVKTLETISNIRFDLARNTNLNIELLNSYDTLSKEFLNFAEAIQMGIDEIQKINKELEVPIRALDATKHLQQVIESYNLYSGSIESGMFAAKNLIEQTYDYTIDNVTIHHTGFDELFKLTTDTFQGSNEEFLMIANNLWAYHDVLHENYKYLDDYITRLRQCLVDVYSRPGALFAPTDALKYFNSLDPQALLTWEIVTKGNLSLTNKTIFYKSLNNFTQMKMLDKDSISTMFADLNTIFRNTGFTDDEAIAQVAVIARSADALEYANRVVDANLMTTLHSLDDLGKYKDELVKYLKDDVTTNDDIVKTIIDIERDSGLRRTYDDFGNVEDLRDLGGTNYGYEETLYRNQLSMYQERCSMKAISIANMNAEELATHIYKQTPGAMIFHNAGIIKTKLADGTVEWRGIENIFNFTEDELKNAGLKIMKEVNEDGDWYYIRLIDNRVHNAPLKYEALPRTHEKIQQRITDLIDKYRHYLNMYDVEDVPSNLITVETLNENTWNKFMDMHSDFFGDAQERKLYQKFTPQGNSSFFDKSYSRLNLTVIGGYDTYNTWNKAFSDDFIPRSTQLSRNTLAGLTSMVNRSNKINKYLSLFFNNDYALDNPLFVEMFKNANNKRIKDFFAEGKYKVAVLRADKEGLPKVFEYTVTNRRTLDIAIAEGGILVPAETYAAMRQVVNKRKMTNNLLDVYRRVVPSTYKSMYLYTAGFPFRNGLDSLIFKNANELGGISSLPKVFMYEREASKALELHNKIQQEVFDITGGETFNKQTLLQVLSKHTKEDAEVYYLTDLFIESGASGSLSSSMADYLEEFNKKGMDDIRPLWEKFYEDKVLFGKQKLNPLNMLRNFNDHIEQTARMGLFLASVDAGMPINDAIARVVKTHFDYKTGSDLMDICERIFWFSTFPINNFNYYVNGGLTKSPTMIKLVMDTQVASWNNGEYTYEELKKTNFLAFHALTGNLRIGNWIVKTSPSLFDFLGLVTDAPGNIKDRLNPFLALPMTRDLNELNPAQSQFRLWPQQFKGNYLPSIFSKINTYNWDNVRGKWRNYGAKAHWTSYPKIKKPTAQIRYVRKYYARKYRTNVRRFSRTSLWHDDAHYYRIGGRRRGITYIDL